MNKNKQLRDAWTVGVGSVGYEFDLWAIEDKCKETIDAFNEENMALKRHQDLARDGNNQGMVIHYGELLNRNNVAIEAIKLTEKLLNEPSKEMLRAFHFGFSNDVHFPYEDFYGRAYKKMREQMIKEVNKDE